MLYSEFKTGIDCVDGKNFFQFQDNKQNILFMIGYKYNVLK